MRYTKIKKIDVANGIGPRTTIFVSGCSLGCIGCFALNSWDFNSGNEFTQETIDYILDSLEPFYVDGLTISGGEPLEPDNLFDVLELVKQTKEAYPDKTIWLYTGYMWEDLFADAVENINIELLEILSKIDILVDGPYDYRKADQFVRFRGSTNQRILDAKASFESHVPVIWHDEPVYEPEYA